MSRKGNNSFMIKFISLVLAFVMASAMQFSNFTVSYAADSSGADLAGTSTKTDANKSGLIIEEGHCIYYINGKAVTTSGWYSSDGNMYYVGSNGFVTQKFTRSGDIIKIYSDESGAGRWSLYKNTWKTINNVRYYLNGSGTATKVYTEQSGNMKLLVNNRLVNASKKIVGLNDGKDYVFDSKGKKISKTGWYTTSDHINLYVGKSGNVAIKIGKHSGVYRSYRFDNSKKTWKQDKSKWVKSNTRLYYFSESGGCTVAYDLSAKKLYRYSSKSKKYLPVKNELNKLNGSKYYFFNSKGVRTTSAGWKNASAYTRYYVNKNGYVTAKFTDKDNIKKYYEYSYTSKKWVSSRNCWKTVGYINYYFNSKGIATVSYHTDKQKAYTFTGGRWKPVKSAIQKIKNVNYYFNSKGVRVKKAGVYKTANGYLAYVNSRGVVYKREYNLEVKRYYTIDLGNGKKTKVYGYYDLGAAKKLMKSVNEHRNENGLSSLAISTSLTETAATRAKEISNTYSHYRPNGTLCINSMYELYGENLACGFSEESLVFRAWTKSTAHDSNMLSTTYKTMGAAVFVAIKNDNEGFQRYYVLTFGK